MLKKKNSKIKQTYFAIFFVLLIYLEVHIKPLKKRNMNTLLKKGEPTSFAEIFCCFLFRFYLVELHQANRLKIFESNFYKKNQNHYQLFINRWILENTITFQNEIVYEEDDETYADNYLDRLREARNCSTYRDSDITKYNSSFDDLEREFWEFK